MIHRDPEPTQVAIASTHPHPLVFFTKQKAFTLNKKKMALETPFSRRSRSMLWASGWGGGCSGRSLARFSRRSPGGVRDSMLLSRWCRRTSSTCLQFGTRARAKGRGLFFLGWFIGQNYSSQTWAALRSPAKSLALSGLHANPLDKTLKGKKS